MLSMTGFGRGSAQLGERTLRVEIRSVNHRGLDLKVRTHDPDAYCDAEIARTVRASIERGAVTVQIRDEAAAETTLDEGRIRALHASLERLRGSLGIEGRVDLATVAAFMGMDASGPRPSGEALWEILRPAVESAVAELRQLRAREGAALAEELTRRIGRLGEIVAGIASGADELPARFGRRLEERLAAVRGQAAVDPARLAQEIAFMAERLDVSEEIVRLRTHLAHLGDLVAGTGAVGRKLDFVIQEVGRELNTIGSKVQDASLATLVIEGKAELEKIREQSQNVE